MIGVLICKFIQTSDIKKNSQRFYFLLPAALSSTLHSALCPTQKLLLSNLLGCRTSPHPSPQLPSQIRLGPYSIGLASHIWHSGPSPSLLTHPPHLVSRLLHLHPVCWFLSSKRQRSPEFSSWTSSLTVLTSLEIFSGPKGLNIATCWQVTNLYL